jgi:hypothetical protein
LAKIKIKTKGRSKEDKIIDAIGPLPLTKSSRLSIAQIQNYMLSISIMKTIALKHANVMDDSIGDGDFEIKIGQQIEWLLFLEDQIDSRVHNG